MVGFFNQFLTETSSNLLLARRSWFRMWLGTFDPSMRLMALSISSMALPKLG